MEVEFLQQNWLLFVALVAIVLLITLDSIRRRSSGAGTVSAVELPALINHESAVVVDISEPNDFKRGHVPNAINLPLGRLQEEVKKLNKYKGKPIVVTCRAGNKSGQAAAILARNEFDKIYTLHGGIAAWEKENMPLEK